MRHAGQMTRLDQGDLFPHATKPVFSCCLHLELADVQPPQVFGHVTFPFLTWYFWPTAPGKVQLQSLSIVLLIAIHEGARASAVFFV